MFLTIMQTAMGGQPSNGSPPKHPITNKKLYISPIEINPKSSSIESNERKASLEKNESAESKIKMSPGQKIALAGALG